eukprot:8255646-Ditylum_brightwellii.AAC.1
MSMKRNLNQRQDITASTPSQAHIMKVSKRRSIENTMGFVMMSWKSATMNTLEGSTYSPLTASWKSRGSDSNKVNVMLKEYNNSLHAIRNFKELLISSSNESIECPISNALVKATGNEYSKLVTKK